MAIKLLTNLCIYVLKKLRQVKCWLRLCCVFMRFTLTLSFTLPLVPPSYFLLLSLIVYLYSHCTVLSLFPLSTSLSLYLPLSVSSLPLIFSFYHSLSLLINKRRDRLMDRRMNSRMTDG